MARLAGHCRNGLVIPFSDSTDDLALPYRERALSGGAQLWGRRWWASRMRCPDRKLTPAAFANRRPFQWVVSPGGDPSEQELAPRRVPQQGRGTALQDPPDVIERIGVERVRPDSVRRQECVGRFLTRPRLHGIV